MILLGIIVGVAIALLAIGLAGKLSDPLHPPD